MFSDFFGGGKSSQKQQVQNRTQQSQQQQNKSKDVKSGVFGPFPRGPRGLVEKSPLIKHSPRKQDEIQRKQSVDRNITNTENQAFLKDVMLQIKLLYLLLNKIVFRLLTQFWMEKGWVGLN